MWSNRSTRVGNLCPLLWLWLCVALDLCGCLACVFSLPQWLPQKPMQQWRACEAYQSGISQRRTQAQDSIHAVRSGQPQIMLQTHAHMCTSPEPCNAAYALVLNNVQESLTSWRHPFQHHFGHASQQAPVSLYELALIDSQVSWPLSSASQVVPPVSQGMSVSRQIALP